MQLLLQYSLHLWANASTLLYMHNVRWPLFPDYERPAIYGLAPNKAFNLHINTADNETLGAWFLFSDSYYQKSSLHPSFTATGSVTNPVFDEHLLPALQSRPTVLLFHGNAANRAASYRVALYAALSSRLDANVLVVDYRGFGDSTGSPTEAGLLEDAKAAWNWVVGGGTVMHGDGEASTKVKAEDVLIVGHSLGTSVAAMLGEWLDEQGVQPKGLALVAPFSNVPTIARTFAIFGLIPVLRPITSLPGVYEGLTRYLIDTLDTQARLPKIAAPILLVHALDDTTIPASHSTALFEELLSPQLPPVPYTPAELTLPKPGMWDKMNAVIGERQTIRARVVREWNIEGWGVVREFDRPNRKLSEGEETMAVGKVRHVETTHGDHVDVLKSQGVLNIFVEFFGMD
ncbi:alpha/beta-hydrolase [Clavulina sp. PMI_390]|nr:alpha/beta-hydrolase [Clavulina sp. PMI_390]